MLKKIVRPRIIFVSILCSFLFAFITGNVVNAEGNDTTITFHTDYSKFGVVDGNDVTDLSYKKDGDWRENQPTYGPGMGISGDSWWLITKRSDSEEYDKDIYMEKYNYIFDRVINNKIIIGWKIRGGDGTVYKNWTDVFRLDSSDSDIVVDAVWENAYTVTLTTDVSGFGTTKNGEKIQKIAWTFPEGFEYTIGTGYYSASPYEDWYKLDIDYSGVEEAYNIFSLKMDSDTHTYDQYFFDGYKIEGDDDTLYQQNGSDTITVNKDINLVAVWEKGVVVTFDAGDDGWLGTTKNGLKITQKKGLRKKNTSFRVNSESWDYYISGSYCDFEYEYIMPSDAEQDDEIGSEFSLPVRFDGYVCDEFKIKDSDDDKVYEKYSSIKIGEEDITIVPVWTKAALITYDANGGKFKNFNSQWGGTESKLYFSHGIYEKYERTGTDASYNDEAFSEIPYSCNYTNVEKEGYMLTGWRIKGDDSEKIYSYNDSDRFYVDGDIILEAVWGDIATFTFDFDGGEVIMYDDNNHEVTYDSYTEYVPKGGNCWVDLCKNPEKAGYTFDGWKIISPSIDDELYKLPRDIFYDIKDTTFQAQWSSEESYETCIVTFDANGGYWYKEETDNEKEYSREKTFKKGVRFNSEDEMSTPLNDEENLRFCGWSTNREYLYYDEDGEVISSYRTKYDITLYAIWEEKTGDVTDPTATPSPTVTPDTTSLPTNTPTSDPTGIPTTNVSPTPTMTPSAVPTNDSKDKATVEPTVTPTSKVEPTVTAPKKATISKVKNAKGKKISLKWKKVSGVKGYEVQYALNSSFTKSLKKKSTTKNTLTIKKLKKKKTYYIRVRSYVKDSNNKKVYSEWSKVKKVKIKK
ncbi:repeat domain (List_Bact_rpt) [Lachnospiraceae bacterium]|nr:repeat domain (List_Bact_rpt) [Lachnospiraceae bacterium]